jgi:hypothetical protein
MSQTLPPCRLCGGALQRVDSMPGHVVCGSGHLYLEKDAHDQAAKPGVELERVGEDAEKPGS